MFGHMDDCLEQQGEQHENYTANDESEYVVEVEEEDEETRCLIRDHFAEMDKTSSQSPLHDCQEAESCLMNDVDDCVRTGNDSATLYTVSCDNRVVDSRNLRELHPADPEEKAILDLLDINGKSHCLESISQRGGAIYNDVDDIAVYGASNGVDDFTRMIGSLQVSKEASNCERLHPNPVSELDGICQESGKNTHTFSHYKTESVSDFL